MCQDVRISEDNNNICELVECLALTTIEVKVKVGEKGSITLFLCENCKSKFLQDGENS
jgi:hypothetical protein